MADEYLALGASSDRSTEGTAQVCLATHHLDIEVISSGCLEVCKLGPVVFHSGDRTWYTRVTPDIAEQIVREHLVEGEKVIDHLYPKLEAVV